MTYRFIITGVVMSTIILLGASATSSIAGAQRTEFKTRIVPLECVDQTVQNGVSVDQYLSPEECDDLINPKPTDPKEPEGDSDVIGAGVNDPDAAATTRDMASPNTGFGKILYDAVVESKGLLIVMVAVAVATLVILVRKRRSNRKVFRS